MASSKKIITKKLAREVAKAGLEHARVFFSVPGQTYGGKWDYFLEKVVERGDPAFLKFVAGISPKNIGERSFTKAIELKDLDAATTLYRAMRDPYYVTKAVLNEKWSDIFRRDFPVAFLELLLRIDPRENATLEASLMVKTAEAARMLLEKFKVELNPNGPFPTPLQHAIHRKRNGVAKVMVQHGADPTIVTTDGFTALHAAAAGGNLSWIRRLINQYHLRADAVNEIGDTMLIAAMGGGDFRLRLSRKYPRDLERYSESVDILVEAGCRVQTLDIYGESALLAACQFGDGALPLIRKLHQLDRSLLYKAVNSNGYTPLMIFLRAKKTTPEGLIEFLKIGPYDASRLGNIVDMLAESFSIEYSFWHPDDNLEEWIQEMPSPALLIKPLLALGANLTEEARQKLFVLPEKFYLPDEDEIVEYRQQIYFSHSLLSQVLDG